MNLFKKDRLFDNYLRVAENIFAAGPLFRNRFIEFQDAINSKDYKRTRKELEKLKVLATEKLQFIKKHRIKEEEPKKLIPVINRIEFLLKVIAVDGFDLNVLQDTPSGLFISDNFLKEIYPKVRDELDSLYNEVVRQTQK